MTTSGDLMSMLRASMNAPSRPSPGYIVGELEAPAGGRRADALFLPLGHARRGEIHGYEFKISRADLVVELNDPMKADPWLRYCTTWNLFVSDPALIRGLDIPEAWGILAPPSGGRSKRALTVVRPAPKLRPVEHLSPALLQVIARLYYGDGITEGRLRSQLEHAESMAAGYEDMRRRALDAERRLARLDPTQTPDGTRDLVDAVVNRLASVWLPDYRARVLELWGADRIVELMTDIAALESLHTQLAATADTELQDLERVHEQRGQRIKQARKTLDQHKKGTPA